MHLVDTGTAPAPQAQPLTVEVSAVEDFDYLVRVDLTDVTGVIARLFDVIAARPDLRRAALDLIQAQGGHSGAKIMRAQALAVLADHRLVRETFGADLTPEQALDVSVSLREGPDLCALGCGRNAAALGLCVGDAHLAGVR